MIFMSHDRMTWLLKDTLGFAAKKKSVYWLAFKITFTKNYVTENIGYLFGNRLPQMDYIT